MSDITETAFRMPKTDKAVFEDSVSTAENFFIKNKWKYKKAVLAEDAVVFYLGFTAHSIALRVKVFVENNPAVCRIDVILPAVIDKTYEHPLCRLLNRKNSKQPIGVFKYICNDGSTAGEVPCQYSFFISNGLTADALDTALKEMIRYCVYAFDDIKKYADGKFTNKEINEIFQSILNLLDNIPE